MTTRFVVAFLAILTHRSATAADPSPSPAPADVRQIRVYVFDGFNPLRYARVHHLAARLRENGFPQTQIVRWNDELSVERDVRAAHAADPNVQIALVGYSAGSYSVRRLANRLIASGVPVAAVGYVGGDYLTNSSRTQVLGAGRVMNVTGNGYLLTGRNLLFNGTQVSGATNIRLSGIRHFDLPTHPATFEALMALLN